MPDKRGEQLKSVRQVLTLTQLVWSTSGNRISNSSGWDAILLAQNVDILRENVSNDSRVSIN